MKTVDIQETNLDACVPEAQSDRIVLMRGGQPVAIVVGVAGRDEEQTQTWGQRQVVEADVRPPRGADR
jgi:hypothetical protein